MDKVICLSGISCRIQPYYVAGLYAAGCSYEVSDKCSADVEIVDEKIIIRLEDKNIIISEEKLEEGIWINHKSRDAYIHRYLSKGKTLTAYMTRVKINKYILAGIIYCNLLKGIDLYKAVDQALYYISMGEGDPFKYIDQVIGEYRCYTRILEAMDRLTTDKEVLNKLSTRQVIIGCRGAGAHNVLVGRIIPLDKTFIQTPIRPYSIELYPEYKVFEENTSFICIDKDIDTRYLEDTAVIDYRDMKCIVGRDPVKIVILLEKRFS